MSPHAKYRISTWAIGIAIVVMAATLIVAPFGGFETRVLGVRLSAHDPVRSLVLAALAAGLSLVLVGARSTAAIVAGVTARVMTAAERVPPLPIAIALGVALATAGVIWTSRAAGGSDSYGYMSQAELWLKGALVLHQPWALNVPWPNAEWTFTPLAYQPGSEPGTIVPTYPPGLPMLMAAVKAIAGQCGLFWISPVAGALTIFATFGIGRRIDGPHLGLAAAWLLTVSPVLMFGVMQPMSDVPVTAAWTIALWALLGSTLPSAAIAGLFAGVAVLIRPNLVPIGAVMGLWLALRAVQSSSDRRRAVMRLAAFAASVGLGGSIIAVLNHTLYGSPFRFGYGAVGDIFSMANVWPNLIRYGRWFIETQTWLGVIGLLALFAPLPRRWFPSAVRPPVVLALIVTVLTAEYCAYVVFEHWSYLRFFLPVWPVLMLGVSLVLVSLARRSRPAAFAVLVVTIALGCQGFRVGKDRYAFDWQRGERKFPTVGTALLRLTPPNAVIFSMQHSGAIRYYSGRTTFAYPSLDAAWLDRTVEWLAAHGAHPYAVLESWEVTEFRGRFSAANTVGRLAMTPIAAYRDPDIYVYDLLKPMSTSDRVEILTDREISSCPQPAPPQTLVLK